MPEQMKVRAVKDRRVVFPRSVLSAPGGKNFDLSGNTVVMVPRCSFVLKRLRAGDLELVEGGQPRDEELLQHHSTTTRSSKRASTNKEHGE
jgi:hypothetical protein